MQRVTRQTCQVSWRPVQTLRAIKLLWRRRRILSQTPPVSRPSSSERECARSGTIPSWSRVGVRAGRNQELGVAAIHYSMLEEHSSQLENGWAWPLDRDYGGSCNLGMLPAGTLGRLPRPSTSVRAQEQRHDHRCLPPFDNPLMSTPAARQELCQ